MHAPKISALEFVDFYIGENYCDIKGLSGASAARVCAPDGLAAQIAELRKKCQAIYRVQQEPEFALILDDVLFRVTQISDVAGEDVFILRRSGAQIRPLATLGLAPHAMRAILDPQTRGLILIAGEMGTGKTSTAASIVVQRLKDQGGIAIAFEDPPETRLNGLHGPGRCIQVRASRKRGGYQEHLIRAMRTGADLILIGEIRDEDTAFQALQASINGPLIIATIHAGDIMQAIERMQTFCNGRASNTNEILADGLAVVIWQTLEKAPQAAEGRAVRFVSQSVIFNDQGSAGIRAKICKGLIAQVMQDVEEQSRHAAWNMPDNLRRPHMKRADLQSQQGFTALEMLVVLIVTVAALGLGAQYVSNYADTLANQSSAEHQKTVSDAAVRYIKDHYAALLDAAGPTTPATVTVPMLKRTGYLPTSFADQNPFGQDYKILVLRPTEQKLESLIVSIGGEPIPEMSIRRIAQLIGAHGGFISSIDATKVQGSYGGWQVSLSSYGESPGAGHLATALFFEDGALISDYLYRSAVGGYPELNRMNTAIDMAGNDINNGGQVNATTMNATGSITAGGNISATGDASAANANIRGDTTTGNWFQTTGDGGWHSQKWNGGWYMSDPDWVRSYADKNIYTGGQVRAGTVNANGRLSAGEFLQLDGVANLGWGCSPNGLVGRDGSGLLLSCQSGVWRKQGGGFAGWQQVGDSGYAPHSGILVATSCFNCRLTGYASGIQRFAISERDRYGQGFVSGTMPVMRGEAWQFSGAQTVWLMSFED